MALTQAQISQRLGHDTDRVTLYRNLRSLMQAGILHEINAGTTNPCYALCPPFAMQPSTSTGTFTFYVILAAQPIV